MSSEHTFDDKGKVKPKPAQEAAEPGKDDGSLTAADLDGKLNASTLTHMQKTVGNAAVQRFLAQRQGSGPAEIQEETASAINSKRGRGGQLDSGMAERAGAAMGHDFSGVNVHTDGEADQLSRGLGAKAFTTGSDIFFQSGAYNPGSSDGQQLLAHELTHVVQQGGSAPSGNKMTVNDPNDQYEDEADSVADTIMNKPDASLQRQDEDEMSLKPDPALQRQDEDEMSLKTDPALQRQIEEEPMRKVDPALQRAETPEEEEAIPPVQSKPDPSLQRAMPEEEVDLKVDPSLQREGEEEEEAIPPAQLKADPSLQRQVEEEEEPPARLKADPSLQRAAEEEEAMPPAQLKADPSLQRAMPEEEVDLKVDPALQRQDDDELV